MADTPVSTGPSAPVPKDPQPTVDRIEDLARRILSGDILLPKFQRSFVWDRGQVLKLLDSVAKGYPIGGILLWQSRQELRSENRIADLDIELPKPDYPVNYLLDGQQRLSTICGAMFWRGGNPRSIWNVGFDLRNEKFVHLDTEDDVGIQMVRMNLFADPADYFQRVSLISSSSASDKNKLKERAEALFRRFIGYKIATVTLGDMKIEDVAPIFERINSTGTRLTIVDLMRAATWSPDFDLVDSIDAILEDLQAKGYEGLEKRAVLRNISASAGGGFSASSIDGLRDFDVETLRAAVRNTREAYKKAIDFLATEMNVPNASIIPYTNQVVVLAEFFRCQPAPRAFHFAELKRWFWKTAAAGYFSGWNTGQMRQDRDTVRAYAAGRTSGLAGQVPVVQEGIWKDRRFKSNTAHSKLLAILLVQRRPVDILTGQRIDTGSALSWANQKEFHHFFPQDYLKNQGYSAYDANSLSNIILLSSSSNKRISNRAPSDYLEDVMSEAGDSLEDWLERSYISEAALEAAVDDNYEEFLLQRSITLSFAVTELSTRAQDGEPSAGTDG